MCKRHQTFELVAAPRGFRQGLRVRPQSARQLISFWFGGTPHHVCRRFVLYVPKPSETQRGDTRAEAPPMHQRCTTLTETLCNGSRALLLGMSFELDPVESSTRATSPRMCAVRHVSFPYQPVATHVQGTECPLKCVCGLLSAKDQHSNQFTTSLQSTHRLWFSVDQWYAENVALTASLKKLGTAENTPPHTAAQEHTPRSSDSHDNLWARKLRFFFHNASWGTGHFKGQTAPAPSN